MSDPLCKCGHRASFHLDGTRGQCEWEIADGSAACACPEFMTNTPADTGETHDQQPRVLPEAELDAFLTALTAIREERDDARAEQIEIAMERNHAEDIAIGLKSRITDLEAEKRVLEAKAGAADWLSSQVVVKRTHWGVQPGAVSTLVNPGDFDPLTAEELEALIYGFLSLVDDAALTPESTTGGEPLDDDRSRLAFVTLLLRQEPRGLPYNDGRRAGGEYVANLVN